MEETLKTLFSADKSKEGYSFQLTVWDNAVEGEHWDQEFMFYSSDMEDPEKVKYVTKDLVKFMDNYKKTPLRPKKVEKRGRKKKVTTTVHYKKHWRELIKKKC